MRRQAAVIRESHCCKSTYGIAVNATVGNLTTIRPPVSGLPVTAAAPFSITGMSGLADRIDIVISATFVGIRQIPYHRRILLR